MIRNVICLLVMLMMGGCAWLTPTQAAAPVNPVLPFHAQSPVQESVGGTGLVSTPNPNEPTVKPLDAPQPAPIGSIGNRHVADLEAYINVVRRLVRAQMHFTEKVKGNPEVLIEVKLKSSLRVASVSIVKSSGNKGFDAAVKAAVLKAGRYPPLPEGIEFSKIKSHKIKYRLNETA